MGKRFREWNPKQVWLLPPSVDEFIPEGHVAHFVRDLVADELDLSAIFPRASEGGPQGPAELHGSREPGDAHEGRLPAVLQRAGRSGCGRAGDRGLRCRGDECGHGAATADGGPGVEQHWPQAAPVLVGRRLLLRGEPQGIGGTSDPRLHRHRAPEARDEGGRESWARQGGKPDRIDAGTVEAWRLAKSLPIAEANSGARVRPDQAGERVPAVPDLRTLLPVPARPAPGRLLGDRDGLDLGAPAGLHPRHRQHRGRALRGADGHGHLQRRRARGARQPNPRSVRCGEMRGQGGADQSRGRVERLVEAEARWGISAR